MAGVKGTTGNKRESITNEYLIYNQYKNVAINRFEWEGLPDGVEERYIENILYSNGFVAFVNDEMLGFLVLPCTPYDGVNVYGEHIKFMVNGYNYSKVYTKNENCVIIKNNNLWLPTKPYVQMYSKRLNQIERTLDVNISQQKTPYVIKVNDKNVLSFKNLYKKVSEDEPVIYADKNLDLNNIEVFPTVAPFIGIEMMDYKNQVRNEILTFLGINNTNTDKKERLVTDEVNSNNQFISSNFEYMLFAREKACDEINKMFGLNVSVAPRVIEEETEDGTSDIDDKTTD